MLPEASESNQLVLYKSDDFPKSWKPYKIVCDEFLIDASLLYFENVWYLFASKDNGCVSLFYSDHITNLPFVEHQSSPIRTNDKIYSRSGGRPFMYEKKLYRIAQATVPNYGNKVTLINIVKLSKTEYFEEITDSYDNISASGIGWNSTGMHHVDVQLVDDKWIAAVDGHSSVRFWGIQMQRLLFFNKYK